MNEEWWESPFCILCDYWWVFLSILVLLFSSLLTRNTWIPALFPPTPTPSPTLTPTSTITPLPTATQAPTSTPSPIHTSTLMPTIVLGTGDVQATLTWNTIDDLDLHILDPNGEEIFFENDRSMSGGKLDVDSNAGCTRNITQLPVENIFWPEKGAPDGQYVVTVVYYQRCSTEESIPFHVRILVDGKGQEFDDRLHTPDEKKTILTFSR